MPYETKREHLKHLKDLIFSYPERREVDSIKLFIGLEHVFVSLDIYDFDLNNNQDLWVQIQEGLAAHPLRYEGEALCKLRSRDEEKKGHWWHNPRNWTTESKTERDELAEIINFLEEWSAKDDKWMVANYFHVLEELNSSKNRDLWEDLISIAEENFALQKINWKRYAAWTKDFKEEWWWWKIGEELCKK